MAVRSTNTYQEGLQSLIQDVASLMLLPDANPDFLFQLQNELIGEANAPLQAQAAQQQAMQPGNAIPLSQLAGQAAGPPLAMPQGGPIPGSAPLPPGALGDEVRRMLG